MPLATYPLIAWGSAAAINGWTDAGTPVITTGQADPFGGTSAVLVNDDSAGAAEGKTTTAAGVVGDTVTLLVFAKAGTAAASAFQLRDNTAGAYRIQAALTWSGGVPTLTCSTGTAIGTVSVGGSWYAALATGTWVSGNTAQVEVYGASATASATGTTYWYLRNAVLLDYMDEVVSFARARAGSVWAQAPSGTEDAWITGTDEVLRGRLRFIPKTPTATPVVKSGWYGENESAGVNCGVKAMLTAGRAKTSLLWVADRATASTTVTCTLAQPVDQDGVELEANGDRTVAVEFRGTSVFPGV